MSQSYCVDAVLSPLPSYCAATALRYCVLALLSSPLVKLSCLIVSAELPPPLSPPSTPPLSPLGCALKLFSYAAIIYKLSSSQSCRVVAELSPSLCYRIAELSPSPRRQARTLVLALLPLSYHAAELLLCYLTVAVAVKLSCPSLAIAARSPLPSPKLAPS